MLMVWHQLALIAFAAASTLPDAPSEPVRRVNVAVGGQGQIAHYLEAHETVASEESVNSDRRKVMWSTIASLEDSWTQSQNCPVETGKKHPTRKNSFYTKDGIKSAQECGVLCAADRIAVKNGNKHDAKICQSFTYNKLTRVCHFQNVSNPMLEADDCCDSGAPCALESLRKDIQQAFEQEVAEARKAEHEIAGRVEHAQENLVKEQQREAELSKELKHATQEASALKKQVDSGEFKHKSHHVGEQTQDGGKHHHVRTHVERKLAPANEKAHAGPPQGVRKAEGGKKHENEPTIAHERNAKAEIKHPALKHHEAMAPAHHDSKTNPSSKHPTQKHHDAATPKHHEPKTVPESNHPTLNHHAATHDAAKHDAAKAAAKHHAAKHHDAATPKHHTPKTMPESSHPTLNHHAATHHAAKHHAAKHHTAKHHDASTPKHHAAKTLPESKHHDAVTHTAHEPSYPQTKPAELKPVHTEHAPAAAAPKHVPHEKKKAHSVKKHVRHVGKTGHAQHKKVPQTNPSVAPVPAHGEHKTAPAHTTPKVEKGRHRKGMHSESWRKQHVNHKAPTKQKAVPAHAPKHTAHKAPTHHKTVPAHAPKHVERKAPTDHKTVPAHTTPKHVKHKAPTHHKTVPAHAPKHVERKAPTDHKTVPAHTTPKHVKHKAPTDHKTVPAHAPKHVKHKAPTHHKTVPAHAPKHVKHKAPTDHKTVPAHAPKHVEHKTPTEHNTVPAHTTPKHVKHKAPTHHKAVPAHAPKHVKHKAPTDHKTVPAHAPKHVDHNAPTDHKAVPAHAPKHVEHKTPTEHNTVPAHAPKHEKDKAQTARSERWAKVRSRHRKGKPAQAKPPTKKDEHSVAPVPTGTTSQTDPMAKQHSEGAQKHVENKVPAKDIPVPIVEPSGTGDESTDSRSGVTALVGVILFMGAIVSITTIAFFALEPKIMGLVDKYRESKRTTPATAPELHEEN